MRNIQRKLGSYLIINIRKGGTMKARRGKYGRCLFTVSERIAVVVFWVSLVSVLFLTQGLIANVFAATSTTNEINPSEASCPPGTLFATHVNFCAPINDVRNLSAQRSIAAASSITPPDLVTLRKARASKQTMQSTGMPVPGGIGVGIKYKAGALKAYEHAELYTAMFVYPDGLNPSGPLYTLYTTATNRTEKTIEFLGWYADAIAGSGALWLYDWSCSADYPCKDGNTGPSFQWGRSLADSTCNMTQIIDKGCNLQSTVFYDNMSAKLDNGNPPLWQNVVYLWNYCNNAWDMVYEHQFRANQIDCSASSSSCGWWGPILETFDASEPQIKLLGFQDTILYHDGTWSYLPVSETDFSNPVAPWTLSFLEPNRSYGAGNYATVPPPTVVTSGATAITMSGATLNGTVNANNTSTTVTFEWGLTTSYGNSMTANPSPIPAVCGNNAVNGILSGLTPNTTYHYRVEGVNSSGTSYGDDMTFTTLPPQPWGSILINGGASATKSASVTLTLSAEPNVTQMCLSNTTSCTSWETYATTRMWTLQAGDGTKTVYVWFKDNVGNANITPYSALIILDTTAPANGRVTATPGSRQVTLSWTGFTDTASGIAGYKVVYATGSAPTSCSSGTAIYNGPNTSYIHTGLTKNTTYYYRVCATDKAGNMSTGATASAKSR